MISYARQNPEQQPDATAPPMEDHIAPAPRVSVQAFCETVETAAAVQSAGEDRRLGKAHLKIQMGGMAAAIEAYNNAPTPNVIVLESEGRSDLLAGLEELASVCDAGTRVIVIGRMNDVTLYRELVRRGVSEYVIAPVTTIDVVRAICTLFSMPEAKPVGRVIAVVGAKGGVGASTVAHNVAWSTAPDLANLRNTKNLFDMLKGQRPNDRAPLYCLNQVGVPKRPEIKTAEFAKAIESEPAAVIPFEPQLFGLAANNGQMIEEIAKKHKVSELFVQIAQRLTGRTEAKKPRGSLLSPLLGKLMKK